MVNEKTSTDQMVRRFIEEIGVEYEEQGSSDVQIKEALKNASKSENSVGVGKPEFIFFSGGHLFVIEDKLIIDKLEYKDEHGKVNTAFPYRRDYAVNGAIHYAKPLVVHK